MSIPGFTAAASLGGRKAGHITILRPDAAGDGGVIPALPIGGYGQIACVKAICNFSPKDCPRAWRLCGGGGGHVGVECTVSSGSVTCCYAGDCTTFW